MQLGLVDRRSLLQHDLKTAVLLRIRNKNQRVNSNEELRATLAVVLGEIVSEINRAKRHYFAPILKRVTPDQAKMLLLGQSASGDQGAKDLLNLFFPGVNEYERVSLSVQGEGERGFVTTYPSRVSLSFLHTLFREAKHLFVRMIRG